MYQTRRRAVSRRRSLYRSAKQSLRKALSRQWKGRRADLEHLLRAALRGRSPAFLRGIVRAPACAALVALSILGGAHANPTVKLDRVAQGVDGFVIEGEQPGDMLGVSVSSAGDVNGDGLSDLIVGAHTASPYGAEAAGRIYVVFGQAGSSPVDLARLAGGDRRRTGDSGGFIINGGISMDLAGRSVASAGDVNGDGLDDVIVGAPAADPDGRSGAGQSFVVFGKRDGAPIDLAQIVAGEGGGFAINGINAGDFSGLSVSPAGDVNGDGLADVIVGAPRAAVFRGDEVKTFAGQAFVVFGKSSSAPVELADILDQHTEPSRDCAGFAINGLDDFDECGFSVSAAGDVNGDGLDDILVSAVYGNLGDGHAYVIFGKATGTPVNLARLVGEDRGRLGDSGGFLISGADVPGDFGFSVAGAGDVNGDGIPDVIVGSPPYHLYYPSYGVGDAYVVFGKVDGSRVEAAAVALDDVEVAGDSGGFVINGINVHDFCGASVSGAGDFDGDGRADVLVGSYLADPDDTYSAGQVHVVFGKLDGRAIDLSALGYGLGLTIDGTEIGGWSGFSVGSAGDVNGDGMDDIVIGAPRAGDSGRAYVVFSTALSEWVFVDFGFSGSESGTFRHPFDSVEEGVRRARPGGTVVIQPGSGGGSVRIDEPVRLVNGDPSAGVVRIGK